MIFEVTNHLRIAAYCGVREFVTPEDDMIILPDWVRGADVVTAVARVLTHRCCCCQMHRNLFLREGIEVQVRSVAPPKLAFVTVQVCSYASCVSRSHCTRDAVLLCEETAPPVVGEGHQGGRPGWADLLAACSWQLRIRVDGRPACAQRRRLLHDGEHHLHEAQGAGVRTVHE